jgi:hypothetical protein
MPVQTPESICNLALDKLGADPIQSLSAPIKPNEKLLARQYTHQRDAELRAHRWLFALEVRRLTPTGTPITNDLDDVLYRYTMPTNAVRAIRQSGTTWQVRGRELLDPSSTTITVKFVMQTETALFDELFTEALACKLAEVCCEKITRSSDKVEQMRTMYKTAIDTARRINAFEVGPEVFSSSEFEGSWDMARNL